MSKVFWTLVQPLSVLIILIGVAILALYRGRMGLRDVCWLVFYVHFF